MHEGAQRRRHPLRAAWRCIGFGSPLDDHQVPLWSPAVVPALLLGAAGPLTVAWVTGALAIPHNDTWSLSRIAATFTRTGHIHLLNWNDMGLIGQLVLLYPFGSNTTTQGIGVALCAAVTLYLTFRLVGSSVDPRAAGAAAATLALWPGWASLATTYMTDVPTFMLELGALTLARSALLRDSLIRLAGSVALGVWAVTIRPQAAVVLVSVLAYALARPTPRIRRPWTLLCVVAAIVSCWAFEAWRGSLPHGQNPVPVFKYDLAVQYLRQVPASSWMTLGLALLPVVVIAARPWWWTTRGWMGAALSAVLVYAAFHQPAPQPFQPFVGNYLNRLGEYGHWGAVPRGGYVIPTAVWDTMMLLASVSCLLAGGAIAMGWRRVDPLLRLFTLGSSAAIVVVACLGNGAYDRYLIALMPGLTAAILASRVHPGRPPRLQGIAANAVQTVAWTITALVGAGLFLNSVAFDTARWNAAQTFVATGIPATKVDASLEWDGWYSKNGVVDPHDPHRPYGLFTGGRNNQPCITFPGGANSTPPPPGLRPDGFFQFRTFLVVGSSTLIAYATEASGCPTQP